MRHHGGDAGRHRGLGDEPFHDDVGVGRGEVGGVSVLANGDKQAWVKFADRARDDTKWMVVDDLGAAEGGSLRPR